MIQIPTSRGMVILIDDEDYNLVSQYTWTVCKGKKNTTYYATTGSQKISMHRLLMGFPLKVDHKGGDGLNNQKYNLRACTPTQNNRNTRKRRTTTTSQYKGVDWKADHRRWRAQIKLDGKNLHLGYFDTEHAAAQAYDQAALIYFGEFAHLNDSPAAQPHAYTSHYNDTFPTVPLTHQAHPFLKVVLRFWRRVNTIDDETSCWLWTKSSGLYLGPGYMQPSRFSWILFHGPPPDCVRVLKRCRNPLCVRPDHLYII